MVQAARLSESAVYVLRNVCSKNDLLQISDVNSLGISHAVALRFCRACVQQQRTNQVTAAQQSVPQLTEIYQLQTQRACGATISSKAAVLRQQAARFRVPGLQQQVRGGLQDHPAWGHTSCKAFHSCSSSCSNGASHNEQTSGSDELGYDSNKQADSNGSGSIPARDEAIHDLHYRISRIKPTAGKACQTVSLDSSKATDSSRCESYGVSPDGEADIDRSYGSHMSDEDDALSTINTDAASGGLRLRFRRRTPLFQVRCSTAHPSQAHTSSL